MKSNRMGEVMAIEGGRTKPVIESGRDPGADPVAMRDAVYRCLQLAVEEFEVKEGGQVIKGATALAEALGVNRGDTFLRVARKEDSKGQLQRAFVDFFGPLLVHPAARRVFVEQLMAVLDYEPPVARKKAETSDIGSAWLRQLASLPPGEREGRIADMAAAIGVRVEDLRAMAGVR